MIIYDCEIVKAILGKSEFPQDGIEYCNGWRDFAGMGVSVIGVYDYATGRYRVFCADNFSEFQALVDSTDIIIGFNSLGFDNPLCRANGLSIPDAKSYDLLAEIWHGAGLSRTFNFKTHGGFGLDACAQINLGLSKTGNGASAPTDWQRGNIGKVVDYCLNDIFITKSLVDLVINDGSLNSPKDIGQTLKIYRPGEPKEEKEYSKGEIEKIFESSKKVKVVFTKKDGSIMTMLCTNNFPDIPEEFRPTGDSKDRPGDKPTPDHLFPVFDLEANGWRSFTIGKVLSIESAI